MACRGFWDGQENKLIWYTLNETSPWKPGEILTGHSGLSPQDDWTILIRDSSDRDPENKDRDRDRDRDRDTQGKEIQLMTKCLDGHGIDFLLIKRRDKNRNNMAEISDMTSLSFLNEPEMINCLRARYFEKIIYSSIGPILVAVNPFEQLDESVYSIETIKKYFHADLSSSKKLGPHVFQISNNAYNKMFIDKYDANKRENQAILVNGESGAGKTESTKQVLRFLATNSSELALQLGVIVESKDIESLINAVNPITESFGNAKTSRNNNSSRFGKFIELCYSGSGYIIGAHIQTYLLETIRVVSQVKGERNYHIFYEIFSGLTEEQRDQWCCRDMAQFHYLNQSLEYKRYDGESDFDNFSRLVDALVTINLTMDQVTIIFQIVVAILHLGNIKFLSSQNVGEDVAIISPDASLHTRQVSELLSLDDSSLVTAFTKRGLKVAGNYILKNLNVENATVARDTYAKTLYDILFKTLLRCVNDSLSLDNNSSGDEQASSIGVLDIFGFEYFEQNSFEQLCINFANEKLQDHFNYSIFKSEQEIYHEEGIKWNFTNYPDNSERLELFEHKRTGLFLLCDEQLKIPKPSDEKLVKSFYAKCQSHPFFLASKSEQISNEFKIHHFACQVKYSIQGFVEKNRNDISQEIYDSLDSSTNEFIRNLLYQSDDKSHSKKHKDDQTRNSLTDPPDSRERANSKMKSQTQIAITKKTVSVISHFSLQLNELITKIRSMRSHFIRCIKPNNTLSAQNFDYQMVQTQLRCGGALGAVQVFHAGFPNRMDFKYFVTRYTCFLTVCGSNMLTYDLLKCIQRAKATSSDELWRASTSMLLDIISLTIMILHKTESFEIPEGLDLIRGLQMGKTQVFLRAPIFEFLERMQFSATVFIAKILQRRRRAVLLSRQFALKTRLSKKGGVLDSIFLKNCALNSYLYFLSKRRRLARSGVSATILLQRKIRVFLAVCFRKRVILGVTKFKAHFRGSIARKYVNDMKRNSATLIQKCYRRFIWTKKFRLMILKIIFLQANLRRFTAVKNKQMKLKLILALQCLWRGTMARIKTVAYRQKLKQAALEAQRRAAEAKADFMANLDEKLKSNPNLLFDMLGASEKIALLSRQNEALLHANKILDSENVQYREKCQSLESELSDLRATIPIVPHPNSPKYTNTTQGSFEGAPNYPNTARELDNSNCSAQILYLAKQGEKELSQVVLKLETESEIDQKSLLESEMNLQKLRIQLEELNHQLKDVRPTVPVSLTTRPTVERSLSMPSLRISQSLTDGNAGVSTRPFGGLFAAAASRLSTTSLGSISLESHSVENSESTPTENESQESEKQSEIMTQITETSRELATHEIISDEIKQKSQQSRSKLAQFSQEVSNLRQIILFLNQQQNQDSTEMIASKVDLIQDADAQWTVKNLNMKNAALTEELRSVKNRFSSVIGRMEGFSLTKFTMNVLGGENLNEKSNDGDLGQEVTSSLPEEQNISPTFEPSPEIGEKFDLQLTTVPSPFDDAPVEILFSSPPHEIPQPEIHFEVHPNWKPDFVCAVSQWSRKTRREVCFILRVRHVGADIRDWSVVKSFPDFKTLRTKLKPLISGSIDGLFPADGYSLFSISDDLAEERKEALNSYLIALCGNNSQISSGDPTCQIIEDFLGVNEFVNMDRIYARDAGLIITSREINLLG